MDISTLEGRHKKYNYEMTTNFDKKRQNSAEYSSLLRVMKS